MSGANDLVDRMDQNGQDLDVWGGAATRPSYVPRPGQECVRQKDGSCTCSPGLQLCEEFRRQMALSPV